MSALGMVVTKEVVSSVYSTAVQCFLNHRSVNVSTEGPGGKHFELCVHMDSIITVQLCCCNMKTTTDKVEVEKGGSIPIIYI